MQSATFTFKDPEEYEIFVYKWSPDPGQKPKAVVQIAHGMAEEASRYKGLAQALTGAGYLVYADDHRGHGRTAGTLDKVGYMGKDGFNGAVEDLRQLNQIIRAEYPGLPVFLLGHSMGSFLTQQYIYKYGSDLSGAILSGTSGPQGPILSLGRFLARLVIIFKGAQTPSPFLDQLTFGSYNQRFKPNRTRFDWLSRDEAEVDAYLANPFCGTIFSAGYFYDLCGGLQQIHWIQNQRKIPTNLPIYAFSGTMDPVGRFTRTVRRLLDTYQQLNIRDVTYKFYPEGRHEMLNEINRDEVIRDLIAWLDKHVEG
ncbi:MAG TPA: alpha/beta hydrolase [Bacillota bacterium]|nr:alpha/beta hydrolase [Bacillota bacterium]